MSKPEKKYIPAANPDMHRAMVGKRTSNAAGTHADRRTRRARTRAARTRRALRDE
jgi:hypothetical protein